jgi:hypothetical protein
MKLDSDDKNMIAYLVYAIAMGIAMYLNNH